MHWLFLLAILSSSSNLNTNGSASSLNRLAENSLRQQLGNARSVRVNVVPDQSRRRGDFDSFDIKLDGFAADSLLRLADRNSNVPNDARRSGPYDERYLDTTKKRGAANAPNRNNFDLGDILGGGDIGGILGDILGGGKSGSGVGRIGRIRLQATNFTMQGARYDAMDVNFGEVRFNWAKAVRGDFDIQSVQPGSLGLSLNADQAAKLLAPRLPSIRNLRVRFANGLAYVGGRADYAGVPVPFEVGGRLAVTQNEVRADNLSASIARLRLPSFVVSELTRGINPLYDFDPQNRWPLSINLQTAGTNNNALALRGAIAWRGFNSNGRDDYGRDDAGRDDYGRDTERYPEDGAPTYDDAPRYPEDEPRDNRRDNRDRTLEDVIGGIFGRR